MIGAGHAGDRSPEGLDPLAERGFAQGADVYDRARPGYPDEAVARAFRELSLDRGAAVVDLGAGTGKLTRLLAGRAADVTAVEPSAGMRAYLTAALPAVTVVSGTAERMPLDSGSADAVFAGESFHWFRADEALDEIARVLAPGGGLALMWNARRYENWRPPWTTELVEIIGRHRADGLRPENRYESGHWREAFGRSDRFEPLRAFGVDHAQRVDADGLCELVGTWSFVAALGSDERSAALREVREMLERHRVEAVTIPYRTEVHLTRLKG